jgi:hypothetical protein
MLACNATALVLLAAGWRLASNEDTFAGQIPPVNLGVAALLLGGLGNALLLAPARQAVRRRQGRLIASCEPSVPAWTPASVNGARTGRELVVVSAATRHYHRPGCQFVRGKETAGQQPHSGHAIVGRQPCPVCRP